MTSKELKELINTYRTDKNSNIAKYMAKWQEWADQQHEELAKELKLMEREQND